MQKEIKELTAKDKKKLQREANTMVTRAEAIEIARAMAVDEVGQFAEFMREPMTSSVVQAMAIAEVLIDKGIITKDEIEDKYMEVIERSRELEEEAPTEVEAVAVDKDDTDDGEKEEN